MRGLFELRNVNDLLGKLERDFEKLMKSPHDIDTAFNFFVTAEHMLDWQYPNYDNKSKREQERNNDILLQITSHLATGAKHFEAQAKHHKSVKDTTRSSGIWAKGFWAEGVWQRGLWGDRMYIELDADAKDKYGSNITVTDLAEKVLKNWQARIKENNGAK